MIAHLLNEAKTAVLHPSVLDHLEAKILLQALQQFLGFVNNFRSYAVARQYGYFLAYLCTHPIQQHLLRNLNTPCSKMD